jgi:hypothetical protein
MQKLARLLFAFLAIAAVTISLPARTQTAAPKPANVAGEWNLIVEGPNGTGTPSVTFKQDGANLTGTYKGRFGESPVKGTVKGNDINFTATVNAQGQEVPLAYTGTVDGDAMKGKVKFGMTGENTFTGKRKGENAPAPK